MSNIIDFLERLGKEAQLRRASDRELEQALIGAQIDPEVRAAILARDQRRLESLLGASPNVCCMIHSPLREDDDEEQKQQAPNDGDESEPQEQAIRLAAS